MSNHYHALCALNLSEKQKVTVIYRDQGGNVRLLQRYFISVNVNDQDPGGAVLVLKPKARGYDNNVIPVQSFQELLIYDGWIDIKLDDFVYVISKKRDNDVRVLKYENYQHGPFIDIAAAHPDFIYGVTK